VLLISSGRQRHLNRLHSDVKTKYIVQDEDYTADVAGQHVHGSVYTRSLARRLR
jgi:hypothetical protein